MLSCNRCCSGKAVSVKCSECVPVALGIQCVICMHYIFVCGLSGSTKFFNILDFTLPHKRHDFRRKVIEHELCVLIFSINFA